MIDYDAMHDKVITIARTAVGSRLSLIGPTGGQFGAVIKERANAPRPDFPYLTVDLTDTKDEGGWESNRGINSGSGLLFSETHKNVMLQLVCWGDDSMSIMNELSGYLRMSHIVQSDLRDNLGASLIDVSSITTIPIKMEDKWVESNSMSVTLNIVDKYEDTASEPSGEIAIIHNDATLHGSTALDVDIDAP